MSEIPGTPRPVRMLNVLIAILLCVQVFTSLVLIYNSIRTDEVASAVLDLDGHEPIIVVRGEAPPAYASRLEVNGIVQKLINTGRAEEVYEFYDEYTDSREITHLLISAALLYELPVNLVFGLVEWESGFDPEAVHTNGNGTNDIGLWMLHERTFPELTREQMMDPTTSTRNGAPYLRSEFDRYGWWEAAVIAYNGGDIVDVKESTIIHQGKVLTNERELDRAFVERFGGCS